MKMLAALVFLMSLGACGAAPSSQPLDQGQALTEFTGSDAEILIAAFAKLGAKNADYAGQSMHGYKFSHINCTQVPSAQAAPECTLRQGDVSISAGRDSAVIYQQFVDNRASMQQVRGVTEVNLTNVNCYTLDVYRGVSKCFFAQ